MKKKAKENVLLSFIKSNKYILLLIGFSLVFLYPLFQQGMIEGHDNVSQIARTASRILAIQDGQFPIRWAANLNYGYGHPGFMFFYSSIGYLGALMYFFGVSLETSYELLSGLFFVLAPITFFLWMSQLFKKRVAFVSSLLYGLSPYLFLNLYVRAHASELMAMMLAPLILFFIEKNCRKSSTINVVFGAISYVVLMHSHTILTLVFTALFAAYIVVRSYNEKKILLSNLLIIFLGLLTSSYFWIPALLEGKYINSKLFLGDWYKNHFIHFPNFIYSQWGFGSNINEKGGLSVQIGPIQFFIALFAFFPLFSKFKERRVPIFWSVVFLIAIFMSTEWSSFLWTSIHTLQQFQFPWRFIALATLSACTLSGFVLSSVNKWKVELLVIVVALIFAFPMTKTIGNVSYPSSFYFEYKGTTAFHNEATTIWVAGDATEKAKKNIEVIEGEATIKELSRDSKMHKYQVNAKSPVKLLDNTTYFPGWRANVDGVEVPIEFQDQNHRGLVVFAVPQGEHTVNVYFGETKMRLLADAISLLGVTILILFVIFKKKGDNFLSN